jgi:hypothetical protein
VNQAVTTRLENVVSRITIGRVALKDWQKECYQQALICNNLINWKWKIFDLHILALGI